MASIVDTSVKHYLSTMSGAPQLSGTAGSLIALLDAVLVNGFDTKTLTGLTVAGGVATAAFSGSHSATVDSVITVAGSSIAVLNGEQKVTAVGAGVVRFATEAADGTASGTITIKMAPAGWAKVFSGTNLAVYKSTDVQANGHMLRVDDTNAQFARVVGYESMTDVNTGAGPFPTAAQISGGGYWPKSINSNSTPVAWQLAADSRIFYLSAQPGTSSNSSYQQGNARVFGDPVALRPSGDVFATCLNYSTNSSATSMNDGCLGNNTSLRIASPRAYSGLGSAVLQDMNVWGGTSSSGAYSGVSNSMHGPFPNQIDGALYLSKKIFSVSGSNYPRGEFPGIFHLTQSAVWDSIKSGDRVPGTGMMAGRLLLAINTVGASAFNGASSSGTTGVMMLDVTGPWR